MEFKDIEIEKFRGIKRLAIEDFKQINLIAGGNNSGKSSILEAIFLLTGLSSPDLSIRINNFRDYSVRDSDDLNLIFYNLETSNPIVFKSNQLLNGETRELFIYPLFSNNLSENKVETIINESGQISSLNVPKNSMLGLKLDFSLKEANKPVIKNTSRIIAEGDGSFRAIRANYNEKTKSLFINSKFAFSTVIERVDQIITNKQDNEIIEVLKNLEPKITKISVSANRIVNVDIGLPSLIPINVMGDGIRKLLTILTAIYEVRGGILLVDEIDNGLHYSTMKTLWKAIIIACKKFNVQVFATTHNIETLRYLKELISEEIQDFSSNVRHYTLKKLASGEVKSYKYDFDKFEYALNQGIEIR